MLRVYMVDNDFVFGRLVEVMSYLKYWFEMVIFVVEDDF